MFTWPGCQRCMLVLASAVLMAASSASLASQPIPVRHP
jgi:hypothetical protein